MRKLLISLSIASAISLSGCDDESLSSVEKEYENNPTLPKTRVFFNPSDGELSIPNDLLFSGTTDGTLNLPVDDPTDLADPTVAISTLDGWASQQPFVVDFVLPAGVASLNADSVTAPGAVRIFEVVMGASLTDPDCAAVPAGIACKPVGELTYGADFVTTIASANQLAIVPTTPFKSGASYIIALTNNIMDSEGRAVEPADTYITVRQDINEYPLATESQLGLQAAVNSYEAVISAAGANLSEVIQTSAMTIQSAGNSLMSLKGLYAQTAAVAPTALPVVTHQLNTGLTIRDVLVGQALPAETPDCATVLATLQAAAGGTPVPSETIAQLEQVVPFCAGDYHVGNVTLPYYLTESSPTNPLGSLSQSWEARCDSGVLLAGLGENIPPEAIAGPDDAFCQSIGLRDLWIGDVPLDAERNITKYSPIPKATTNQNVKVQITLPNTDFLQGLGMNVTQPDTGWPVVVLMHGITSNKEAMLLLASSLSARGFATVAIDMVLHGERGFDIDGDPSTLEIVTTSDNPLPFMNLENTQVLRDNIRQSVIDLVGLRVGLATGSALPLDGNMIDNSRVYFSGLSLGAMWGIDFVALANTPLDPTADPLFKVNAASFSSPGGGAANFLLDSATFGAYLQSNVTLANFEDFQSYLTENEVDITDPEAYAEARTAFLATANLSSEDLVMFEAAEQYIFFLVAQGVDISNLTAEVFNEYYPAFREYLAETSPVHLAAIDSTMTAFSFAVQTMIESGDPNNYAAMLSATGTPILVTEIFGDGTPGTWDQVIPPMTARSPIAGTEQFPRLMGIDVIDATVAGEDGVSGFIRFNSGSHGSLLDPTSSAAVTAEMHQQVLSLFISDGKQISVTNTDVIVPSS